MWVLGEEHLSRAKALWWVHLGCRSMLGCVAGAELRRGGMRPVLQDLAVPCVDIGFTQL
jgi:hypothetical protein